MRPRIHGLTVCVGYADHLEQTLLPWSSQLASLTIVSAPSDRETYQLWEDIRTQKRDCYCQLFRTDSFTTGGSIFNKGAAMEAARKYMWWRDWILFFDADILPPANWADSLPELEMGYLYGSWRYNPDGSRVDDDRPGYGYFQLFHAKDPKVQHTPLLSTHYKHAGNYDSDFLLSFRGLTKTLDLHLVHIGPKGQWFGVGKEPEMEEMLRNRRGRGIQPSERLPEL